MPVQHSGRGKRVNLPTLEWTTSPSQRRGQPIQMHWLMKTSRQIRAIPTIALGFWTNILIGRVGIYLVWILAWPGWGSRAPVLAWSWLKCKRKSLLNLLSQGNTCLYCKTRFRPGPPELKLQLVCWPTECINHQVEQRGPSLSKAWGCHAVFV